MNESRPGPALFSLLYVSVLASFDPARLDRVCEAWRANNDGDAITGLLIFDGHSFCQFVEGPRASIAALRARLEVDTRHTDMHVLHYGPSSEDRRFPTWRLGYAFSADPAAIERLVEARDSEALQEFDRLLPTFGAS